MESAFFYHKTDLIVEFLDRGVTGSAQRYYGTYVEIKCQLDATEVFLLQILLLAQHVSGITMPIIRSSRVLYSGCCLWYFVLWFSSCCSGVELRVMCCSILQTEHITLSSTPDQQLENHSTKYHRQQPLYNTLELLMMDIVVPETC